ncbi:MAG: radical SAM protein [Endomicrobium sp.]|jgi:radical SAM protein with 4Fe4S-binding SPASM domain|nr:radical SAM protein [Endomicrobium sp.]
MQILDSYITITLELTYNCNFKCVHCFNSYKKAQDKSLELSLENIKYIVEKTKKLDILKIYLFGGEPLLNKNFKEIYVFLWNQGFQITITTNGFLLSKKIIDLFKKYPPFNLNISLYGYNSQTYIDTTSFNVFETIYSNLKSLQESNMDFFIKYIALKTNFNYDLIINFMLKNSFNYAIQYSIIPLLNTDLKSLQYQISETELKQISPAKNMNLKVDATEHYSVYEKKENRCEVWKQSFVIAPNGDMRPCIPFTNSKKINIFKRIKIENLLLKLGNNFNENNIYYGKCSKCLDKDFCECPVIINLYKGKDLSNVCHRTKIKKLKKKVLNK